MSSRASMACLLGLLLAACGGDSPAGPEVEPVTSVRVDPSSITLMAGSSLQLLVETRDSGGNLLLRAVQWTSSNPAVASVSPGGVVSALASGGPVTITAACEGRTAQAQVMVLGVADLQRTWIAERAEFVSVAQPSRKLELVATGGSLTLDLSRPDRYVFSYSVRFVPAGSLARSTQDRWTATGSELTLNNVGHPMKFAIGYDGAKLTLTGARDEFAFTVDDMWNDQYEEVVVNLVLRR